MESNLVDLGVPWTTGVNRVRAVKDGKMAIAEARGGQVSHVLAF
ncbi:hypothetical protein HMPREF0293_0853 [Corynebacterium glucuronolyticum ATCC 51866]|uniref:Uncharacterized protein n=1 Tax=Corynebacterium glucuronolyticum ATCC 51866 TaxID=548478 RepID=A0ABP2DUJ2_9CORY|nr:hypothetical protein HMPREF0293_0853 [Corynebacterium glucuronolyticum ATCC 51866]